MQEWLTGGSLIASGPTDEGVVLVTEITGEASLVAVGASDGLALRAEVAAA